MTKDEALNHALQLVSNLRTHSWTVADTQFVITAIKEALAQPEQEPKCGAIIEVFGKDWRLEYMSLPVGKHKLYTQLYTSPPPQRTWVGLTDDDIRQLEKETTVGGYHGDYCPTWDLIEATEAKLKEKNT